MILCTFTVSNVTYEGVLSEVNGAAGMTWHLTINGRWQGYLQYTDRFIFLPGPSHPPAWYYLGETLGEYVIAFGG